MPLLAGKRWLHIHMGVQFRSFLSLLMGSSLPPVDLIGT